MELDVIWSLVKFVKKSEETELVNFYYNNNSDLMKHVLVLLK